MSVFLLFLFMYTLLLRLLFFIIIFWNILPNLFHFVVFCFALQFFTFVLSRYCASYPLNTLLILKCAHTCCLLLKSTGVTTTAPWAVEHVLFLLSSIFQPSLGPSTFDYICSFCTSKFRFSSCLFVSKVFNTL